MLETFIGPILCVLAGGLLVFGGVVLGIAMTGFELDTKKDKKAKKNDPLQPAWTEDFQADLNK